MVQTDAVKELERLALSDPAAAPLARLQAVALAASQEMHWLEGVPALTMLSDSAPLLHGQTLAADVAATRGLLLQLAATLKQVNAADGKRLSALFPDRGFDPLALVAASITDDRAVLAALATEAGVSPTVLGVVAHVATLPLLLACGQRAAEAPEGPVWPHGFCPVCAAYPTLAELRGLARDRVLRCGRCGTGWPFEHSRCPFCDNQEQQTQGYFAAEAERESRRAVTCDVCSGYHKTTATLGPLTPAQVLVRDLETLELDVVTLEQGYQRPDGLGWPLTVTVKAAALRRSNWLRGWR
jgi:FdhE protein